MYRQWVPYERNSSYNCIPIFLKLCTCFLHGLKMCIWFGYNPCMYFCYFFHFANFVIFWPRILWKCCDSRYLVSATPRTILYWSFWNCVHVFAMVWRCAYGLDIILELIFVTFYAPPPESGGVLCYNLRNFECPSVHPSVCLSVRPSAPTTILVSATPPTVLGQSFWNFTGVLRMVWRYAYCFFQNPEIIFYHFFPIFNLDIFGALILQICIWSMYMYLVSANPPTVFGESFWNFTGVLRMIWRYPYCFFRILKLFFITFFAFLT